MPFSGEAITHAAPSVFSTTAPIGHSYKGLQSDALFGQGVTYSPLAICSMTSSCPAINLTLKCEMKEKENVIIF